jgi:two-component system, response regulator
MGSKRILLVEDNPDDEELTLRALKKNGITQEVVVARDGVQALDFLFGTAELPQLVLLDLKLPKIDGLGVLERVRADPRTKHVPIVVLTSSKEESDVRRAYALGANSYVRKPVDFEKFNEAVKTLGMFWLGLNELPHE